VFPSSLESAKLVPESSAKQLAIETKSFVIFDQSSLGVTGVVKPDGTQLAPSSFN
jgi:hypothetical protein